MNGWMARWLGAFAGLLVLVAPMARAQSDTPAAPDNPAAAAEAEAATAAAEAAAVDVLARFEAAGKDVRTIRCAVEYITDDRLNIAVTRKSGTILFKRGEPHPMFLIAFDKTVSDDIVLRDKEWWLFRDRWLWEGKSKSGTIIKREILAPGEQRDLFRLEDSPIPMPFGQSKDDVLRNFKVRLMPPQMGDPAETDHLYCVPREGKLAKEYTRLEYYVSKRTNLPVRIVAEDANGSKVSIAEFRDPSDDPAKPASAPLSARSINVDAPDGAFVLPAETQGYHVTTEPLDEGAPRGE